MSAAAGAGSDAERAGRVEPGPGLEAAVAEAVAHVRAGDLVAYPTETVWGLGADARSPAAVACLRRWKGREAAQPVSILVPDAAALAALGLELGPAARALAAAFWPGPLTLVLAGGRGFAAGVARADGAVGVRCSPHPVAAALAHALAAAGVGPLTATSLNRHGEPPARTRAEAARLCPPGDPLAPRLVATGEAGPGPAPTAGLASGGAAGPAPARDGGPVRPSTVVDCTGTPPRVLREGAIGADAIARVLAGGAR